MQAALPLHLGSPGIGQRRLHQHRQATQQRAVDQGHRLLHVSKPCIPGDRLELLPQFGDDFLQPLGLEDLGRFAQRAQSRPGATQLTLDVPQLTGLLDGTQGTDQRVEQKQQDQQAVLVEMQLAIAGLVALAPHLVQSGQQRPQLVEVLQPLHVRLADFLTLLARHGHILS